MTNVERNGGLSGQPISIYASSEPLTETNYTSAPFTATVDMDANVDIPDEYSNVFITSTSLYYFDVMKFSWEKTGPSITGDSFTVANFEEKFPQYYYDSQSFAEKT